MPLLESLLFAIVLVASGALFARSAGVIIANLKTGKPDDRFDRKGVRLAQVVRVAFGQTKLLREPLAGILHVVIFWGFVILLAAIAESIGEGLFPGFSFSFLGPLYPPLLFLEDLVGALVLITVTVSLLRRVVAPPERLRVEGHAKRDAIIILALIFVVMVTMFGQNAARIALGQGTHNDARFLSAMVAPLFHGVGAPEIMARLFFWAHMLVVLAFLNYLPSSKHLHVLTSIPNVYFASLRPKGAIKPINLADELQRLDESIAAYQSAVALAPRYADAHYNLALAYERKGEERPALRHWQAYLRLDTGGPWADHARGQIRKLLDREKLSIAWRTDRFIAPRRGTSLLKLV